MKPSSKDRITVSIILVVFLLVLSFIGYVIFGNPKSSGMTTSHTNIVKVDNIQQIELYKKSNDTYAIKVQENNKLYLKYYSFPNNVPYESKYDLTIEQYNKIVEGDDYWFEVDYFKKGDSSKGIIKEVYTENPARY
jgi:hypothetical protein